MRTEAAMVEGSPPQRRRWKTVVSWVLIVLACLLAVLSVVVVFVRNEALNTDTYVSTVTPLASNPAIQAAVAKRVTDGLVAKADLQSRVEQALPRRGKFLTGPITDEVVGATNRIVLRLVQSEKFQRLWVAVNLRAHKQVVALLTGSSEGALQAKNGAVTLDLSKVVANAKKTLDEKGITVFDKVHDTKGPELTLFQSEGITKLQGLTRLLNRVYLLLPILTLLAFAGAIALSSKRRRALVRSAVGLAISMGLVLVIVSLLRQNYLSSLDPSQSKAAAAAVIDTVSASLLDTVRTVLVVAALIAIIGVAVGSRPFRNWLRSRRLPTWATSGVVPDFVAAHRKGLQWGVLAIGLLVLVLWNEPTARVAFVVILIALVLVGLIGLLGGRRSSSGDGPRWSPRGRGDGPDRGPDAGPSLADGATAVGGGEAEEQPVAALGPGGDEGD